MIFTAGVIAELIGGSVEGDPLAEVSAVSPIESGFKGSLSFLANPKYAEHIYNTQASAVLVRKDFVPSAPISATLIRVSDPYSSFAILLQKYNEMNRAKAGIHPSAVIADSAVLGAHVSIGAMVVIEEGATIGDDTVLAAHVHIGRKASLGKGCQLHSGSKVLHDCRLGNRCTLHAGVVVGSDGFGFAPKDDSYSKVPQIGNVILEDDVEVGANTTIDRATMGSTIIRKGVKLDNLIQIAHNVEVGEHTVIAAQTGVAGSTKIGKRCMIGGQVGIIGHLKIGDNVKIAAQSGVGNNLPDNAIVQGSPAFEVGSYRRSYVSFKRLPEVIRDLEKRLKEK